MNRKLRITYLLLIFLIIISLLTLPSFQVSETRNNDKTFPEVIYPRYRIWTTPSAGEEPKFNSPSFEWPSKKKALYSVRLSSSKDFSKNLIERNEIPFAIFNPHKILDIGTWYWQYKTNEGKWNPVDSFRITPSVKVFNTPEIKAVISAIPKEHPRILVTKDDLHEFREKAKHSKESGLIIEEANKYLEKKPPSTEELFPTFIGKNDFENEKIALLSSRTVGWDFYNVLMKLSQTYVLTGDIIYFETAKIWMLEVSKWDLNGPSHTSDFGDAGIMAGMAVGVDTFWDLLTRQEKELIIKPATVRASQFYNLWKSQVESRSSSMHVWQHILHNLLYTSMAFYNEVPEAGLWFEYIYELWIAQAPKMGYLDGAWINGTGYFGMNTLTIIDVTRIFSDLTGVDFLWFEWYKNNLHWLIYAFPPNSIADGFCNDGNKFPKPTINYAGYADAIARRLHDPYALWYSTEVANSFGKDITNDEEFRWYRIQRGESLPEPLKEFNLPQAEQFPDVGNVYMNTSIQNAKTNLMLSIRSSPFGSLAHTHADQNTFNIAYGGKRLFYNTGYRPAMGDPHFLGWYKHTQGHNGILIDGHGQPYSDGAYGWIARFLHGSQISYAVGDASNAYSGEFDDEKTDLGMKHFRRHYIMLRPSIIVIYDDLEADHKAQWSWLLHNDKGFEIKAQEKTILAQSDIAKAKVFLFSSSHINFQMTDQFSVPVNNWTNRTDEDGNTIVFESQWHFSGINKEKSEKMRFLAIFQVNPDGEFHEVRQIGEGDFKVGNWNITAQLNVSKQANIRVWKDDNSASLVSDGILTCGNLEFRGTSAKTSKLFEKIVGSDIFKEIDDQIPSSIKKVMEREKITGK